MRKSNKSKGVVTVQTGIKYNFSTGKYYVKKGDTYLGSYPTLKAAQAARRKNTNNREDSSNWLNSILETVNTPTKYRSKWHR